MALKKEVFECFASPLYKNGKKHLIGVSEAERLQKAAVLRGFTTKRGVPHKRLGPLEMLVIAMRDATSADDFNHEWWAAEASKPKWVQVLDTRFGGGWLYFPTQNEELTPKNLGERIGFQLGLSERKLGRILRDRAYREQLDADELKKAQRGLDPEDRVKVRIMVAGYDNLRQLARERYASISVVRQQVMAVAGKLREQAFSEFLEGMAEGTVRAQEIDLENELSEFNEREEVAEILSDGWWSISRMRSRREITDYVISRLPDRRRAFLEKSRKEPADRQEQYKRFVERLRQTFYEKIGLRPARRGRPVNSVRR
jgi:hypothetical protein